MVNLLFLEDGKAIALKYAKGPFLDINSDYSMLIGV
jgi:hypothetical protein